MSNVAKHPASLSAANSNASRLSHARWFAPLAIILLGVVPLWAVHAGVLAITRKPSADVVIILGVMELAFFLWVRVFSRISLIRQAIVITSFVAVQLVLYSMIRLDGFAGDGRPIWSWKWTPTAAEAFAEGRGADATSARVADLSSPAPHDWPSFRGANRAGAIANAQLEANWKTHPPRLLWRRPVGMGWSSFAVVGQYCVTQEQRGDAESVVCYELANGRELWSHAEHVHFFEVTSSSGPRATPAIDGGNVYALGATGILVCLDGRDGSTIWRRNILAQHEAENCIFGMTGSPLVFDGQVVVAPGAKGASLAAYDAATGQLRWSAGDSGSSYSSPQLAVIDGQKQILNFNADGLASHDAASGEVLWQIDWISNPGERNNVAQPVVLAGDDAASTRVVLSSAYGMGTGLFGVRRTGIDFQVDERWRSQQLQSKFSSVVVRDGYIYGLDLGILTCLDAATGERMWKRGRYGYGQLLLAGTTLLVQMESGDVALVDASPERYRELARLDALDHRTWNHPVLAGKHLLLRNDREAACFELRWVAESQRLCAW